MDKKETKKENSEKASDSNANSSDHNYSTNNETSSSSKSNSVSSSNNKDDVVSQGRAKKRIKGTNENVSSSSKTSNPNEQVSSASSSMKRSNAQRNHQNKKEAQSTSSSPSQISSTNSKENNSDKTNVDLSSNNADNEYASSTSDGTSHLEIKKSNLSSTSSSAQSSSKDSLKDNNQTSDNLPRVPPLRIVINNSNSSKKENNEKVSSSGQSNSNSLPNNNSQIHSTTTTNSERLFSIDSNPVIGVTSSSTSTNTSSTATSSTLTSTNSLDDYDGDENASSSTKDLSNLAGTSTGRVTRSQRAAAQQTSTEDQQTMDTVNEAIATSKNPIDSTGKDLRKRKNRFKVNQSIKQQHLNEEDDNDSTSSSNSSVNNREQLNQLINNQLQCLEKKQFQMPSYNCYHLYLNIRRQVDNRRNQQVHLVHPKIPENFNQFLFNTGSYLLDKEESKFNSILSTNSNSNALPLRNDKLEIPPNLMPIMHSLYIEQDQERCKLSLQHRIERDKLKLSAEQEILRVYSRAELAMTNLNLPLLSACTVLKDEEIYNSIDDDNSLDNDLSDDLNVFANLQVASNEFSWTNKRNASNADNKIDKKLLNAWLQDVTDKWIKIKRDILLRQRREAESLQAIQKLNWSWRGKDLGFEEFDDSYVPIISVEDFHLFPIQNFQ